MRRIARGAAVIAAAAIFAAAACRGGSAAEERAMSSCRLTDDQEITKGLREALLGEAPAFFEALYDVEGIEDADVRPLVAGVRDDTVNLFAMARGKLAVTSCEAVSAERRGSTLSATFLINGETRIVVIVDDLYERQGCLHTQDLVRIEAAR